MVGCRIVIGLIISQSLSFVVFGKFVVERVKCGMENTGCEELASALCGSLLWTMIDAEAGWSLAPSSF
jgi:hypothetical protein